MSSSHPSSTRPGPPVRKVPGVCAVPARFGWFGAGSPHGQSGLSSFGSAELMGTCPVAWRPRGAFLLCLLSLLGFWAFRGKIKGKEGEEGGREGGKKEMEERKKDREREREGKKERKKERRVVGHPPQTQESESTSERHPLGIWGALPGRGSSLGSGSHVGEVHSGLTVIPQLCRRAHPSPALHLPRRPLPLHHCASVPDEEGPADKRCPPGVATA